MSNKILENEMMFEKVNAELSKNAARLTPADFPEDFVLELYCECANKLCKERVTIAYDQYVKAKGGNSFLVKPEHLLPEFERLLKTSGNYWIIAKKLDKLDKPFEV